MLHKPDPYMLTETRTRLISKCVFFSVILYEQCQIVWLDQGGDGMWRGMHVDTACTDGKHIVINGDFFATLTLDERVFVLAHEVYHAMAMHTRRAKKYFVNGLFGYKFDMKLFNIAADAVINQCLIDSRVGKMPSMGVLFPNGIPNKKDNSVYTVTGTESPEDVYEKLLENIPEGNGNGDGDGQSDGQGTIDGNGGSGSYDDDLKMPDTQTDSTISEAEMRAAVQSAAAQAKARGQLPGSLKTFIDEFLEPEVDWAEELHQVIVGGASADSFTWNQPNRRKLVQGLYTPRRIGVHCGPVVCAVDSSGSVSDRELQMFLGEMSSILSEVNPESMTVLWCDSRIDRVDEVDSPEELLHLVRAQGVMGRGGTSFTPPFEWVRDHAPDAAFLIYLTDMYAPFPDPDIVDCPVIWVASSDVVAPFGTTIQIDLK